MFNLFVGLISGIIIFIGSGVVTGNFGLVFYNFFNKLVPPSNGFSYLVWGLMYAVLFSVIYFIIRFLINKPISKLQLFNFGLGVLVAYGLFWVLGLLAFSNFSGI